MQPLPREFQHPRHPLELILKQCVHRPEGREQPRRISRRSVVAVPTSTPAPHTLRRLSLRSLKTSNFTRRSTRRASFWPSTRSSSTTCWKSALLCFAMCTAPSTSWERISSLPIRVTPRTSLVSSISRRLQCLIRRILQQQQQRTRVLPIAEVRVLVLLLKTFVEDPTPMADQEEDQEEEED